MVPAKSEPPRAACFRDDCCGVSTTSCATVAAEALPSASGADVNWLLTPLLFPLCDPILTSCTEEQGVILSWWY